jgi:amino acid adenylation domain-containing protein
MPTCPNVFAPVIPARGNRDDRCVVELVHSHASANPKALAIAHGSAKLTYGELDARANLLARHLMCFSLGREAVVGLCLDHSLDFVVAALAILKAGGAYLPLDSTHPAERLGAMLKDAGARILITDSRHCLDLADGPWSTLNLDDSEHLFSAEPTGPPKVPIEPGMLAYLIYTSGSTGKPKAVEVTHGSLMNLTLWHRHTFNIGPSDRAPFTAAVGFDAAVWELWPYLTAGASLHLLRDKSIYTVPQSLRDWLLEQGITIAFVPTPLAEQLINLDWLPQTPLRVMLTGADTLHEYPPRDLPFLLVNNYGPTECTVVATSGIVDPTVRDAGLLPTIGKPIDNTQVYILDPNLRSVSSGKLGELYIGGAAVARGYRNDPELTAERFVRNPFSSNPEDRLYRTGDFGYFLDDGRIAFSGRKDDQVKIRGHRVEPGEIVAVLGLHPVVRASTVVAREDPNGNKYLVAYVVANQGSELTSKALREFLRTFLPAYMLPAVFVQLEELPLSPHGKVDRQVLPVPDAENTLRDEVLTLPRTDLEAQVRGLIAGLLGTNELGMNDNFFLLGGTSFLGIQLIDGLREKFGVEVPLSTLFEAPTVAGLSAQIVQLRAGVPAGEKSVAA